MGLYIMGRTFWHVQYVMQVCIQNLRTLHIQCCIPKGVCEVVHIHFLLTVTNALMHCSHLSCPSSHKGKGTQR